MSSTENNSVTNSQALDHEDHSVDTSTVELFSTQGMKRIKEISQLADHIKSYLRYWYINRQSAARPAVLFDEVYAYLCQRRKWTHERSKQYGAFFVPFGGERGFIVLRSVRRNDDAADDDDILQQAPAASIGIQHWYSALDGRRLITTTT
ncbi:MAG: hypothetical protein Q9160_001469 [Pyrenula sp. 1 TL-2023]